MKSIHKRSKRNLLIGFGFSLVILIASSVLSYLSIKQLIKSQQSVEHTIEVKENLESLMSRMKDAETGQRGYLLTSDESFLEPFEGSRNHVADIFVDVQALTGNDELQQRELPKMQQLINNKFVIMNQTIADKRRSIPPSAGILLRGKAIMDSLRGVANIMIKREQALMRNRNIRMDRFARLSPVAIGIAALISMIITIIFYLRVDKDAKMSGQLQEDLKEKEKKTSRQIEVISNIAKKISDGKYDTRIKDTDLD
jgi:CHASE3 domain sensor protein